METVPCHLGLDGGWELQMWGSEQPEVHHSGLNTQAQPGRSSHLTDSSLLTTYLWYVALDVKVGRKFEHL